jgi:hypothetical protein
LPEEAVRQDRHLARRAHPAGSATRSASCPKSASPMVGKSAGWNT